MLLSPFVPHTLSRWVLLLGALGTGFLWPFIPWGSIKRMFLEYWPPPPWGKGSSNTHNSHKVQYLNFDIGIGYPGVRTTFSNMPSPLVLYSVFLDETNFTRILIPRARYPQDHSTILTQSRPWTLLGSPVGYRCWGTQHESPVPIYPLGLDKTNFPKYWPPWGKSLLGYPLRPFPAPTHPSPCILLKFF